jgi:ribonucleoside-diphosphate reductase alpha chain
MERPEVLEGYTIRLKTPCGPFFVTLNECENKLYEIQMSIGKSGTCQNLLFRTIALLISVLLQSGISKENIAKALSHQMEGNCGNNKIWNEGEAYHSCIDYTFKKIVEDMANRGEIEEEKETSTQTTT